MATIYIEKKPYEAKEGENLLSTCLGLGFDLPYFCWHPAMHSVGACRQCAVKRFRDEKDTQGKIVMACMTAVEQGMYISIDDPEAKKFRSSVIEWLMTNHPHDCPVCDEGGECHLQDMTVMTGHAYRRFRFKKRTYVNQDMGPFLTHEMNRCIACYRCTRFYNDYARGRDFGVFASRNRVFFGRAESGALESPFAGNLAEVCPTGVFDDKTEAGHYTRKWDLRGAPSICVHCGLGCNTIPEERYGTLRRIRNRYHGRVNGYFLCDRGRYGYEFVGSERRIYEPATRSTRGAALRPVGAAEVMERLSEIISSPRIVGIGSPRASLEANFALKTLVGPDRFYSGASGIDHSLTLAAVEIMKGGSGLIPSLADVASCDAVLVLGEDPVNTAPLLFLNVLQSLRQKSLKAARALGVHYWDDKAVRTATAHEAMGPLFVLTTGPTSLDEHASSTRRMSPAGIARTGFAVAHLIDGDAPGADGLSQENATLAAKIAAALEEAERPLVVSGTSCQSEPVHLAGANITRALRRKGKIAYLSLVMAECNSFGLGLMGPKSLDECFSASGESRPEIAIILENDLFRRAEKDRVENFLKGVRHVVAIDHLFHRTSLMADTVLPAATFAEGEGTLVSSEGRAQRYFQVFPARGGVRPSWQWLCDMIAVKGLPEGKAWQSLEALMASMARSIPDLAPVIDAAPRADFRIFGMKVARQHGRASGRCAMDADKGVREPEPTPDPDSPFTFSMEGFGGRPPSALIPRFWAPGWNSVQSINKFQAEIAGSLLGGDPGARLVEPSSPEKVDYFREVPEAFAWRDGELFVVPSHHVFGSEELSMAAPGVASRAPLPYLGLSEKEMARLHVREGEAVSLSIDGRSSHLPVRALDLPERIAAVPVGLPQSPLWTLPAFGKVERLP